MLAALAGVASLVAAGTLAACGARTSNPRTVATPPSAAPTSTSPLPPDIPAGARPFGLPVDLGRSSVVVRALTTYVPDPPIPGHAGTPVRAQIVIDAPMGLPRPVLHAEVRDPTSGRDCAPQMIAGPISGVVPGQVAHVPFSFVCPEIVRNQLLVTVSVGAARQDFFGPLD